MRFILAGQPNSGKSTIFNSVAGYRSATANFPGSSVSFTVSRALILGREVEVVDLPGIYSLTSSTQDSGQAEGYLLEETYDLIINVVDASRLGRSLELTMQLLELERPMIVALNMMDEAARGGMEVDHEELSRQIGVPVVPTVGRRGLGLKELFRRALQHAHHGEESLALTLDREVEEALEEVAGLLEANGVENSVPRRFVAEKLLERDPHFEREIYGLHPDLKKQVRRVATVMQKAHGWGADQVISGSRHAVAHCIEEEAVTVERPQIGWREWADRVFLHPWTGGPVMVAILGLLFWVVFRVGQRLEMPLVELTDRLGAALAEKLPPETLLGTLAGGALTGIAGGVAIVLPYLLAIPDRTGDSRGQWLPAAHGLHPRQLHAPHRSARQVGAAADPRLRVLGAGNHVGAHPAVASGPEDHGCPRFVHSVLGTDDRDLRSGGGLYGPVVGAWHLSPQPVDRCRARQRSRAHHEGRPAGV